MAASDFDYSLPEGNVTTPTPQPGAFDYSLPESPPAVTPFDYGIMPDVTPSVWSGMAWERAKRFGALAGENFTSVFGDTLPKLLSDAAVTYAPAAQLLVNPTNPEGAQPLATAVKFRQSAEQGIGESLAKRQEIAQSGPQGTADDVLNMVAGSLGKMGGQMLLGGGTMVPSLLALYADSAVEKEVQLLQEGRDRAQAERQGAITGALEAIPEAVGFHLGGKLINDVFKVGAPWLKKLAAFLVADAGGEQVTTIGEAVQDAIIHDRPFDQAFLDDLERQMKLTAMGTVATGGAQLGIMKLTQVGVDAALAPFKAPTQGETSPFTQFPEKFTKVRDALAALEGELKAALAERDAIDAEIQSDPTAIWNTGDSLGSALFSTKATQVNDVMTGGLTLDELNAQSESWAKLVPTLEIAGDQKGDYTQPKGFLSVFGGGREVAPGTYTLTVPEWQTRREMAQTTLQPDLEAAPLGPEELQKRGQRRLVTQAFASMDEIRQQVETWRKQYLPNVPVVLGFDRVKGVTKKGTRGWTVGVMLKSGQQVPFLDISLQESLKERPKGREARFGVAATTAHEFGHALAFYFLHRMPPFVTARLRGEYIKQLRGTSEVPSELLRQLGNPRFELTPSKEASARDLRYQNAPEGEKSVQRVRLMKSWTNFNEWLANELVKTEGAKGAATTSGQILQPLARVMRHFFTKNKGSFEASEGYKLFLRRALVDGRVTALGDRIAKGKVAYSKQLEEMRRNPPEAVIVNRFNRVVGGTKHRPPSGAWLGPEIRRRLPGMVDRFNTVMRWSGSLLDIARMNPHIAGLNYSAKEGGEGYVPAVRRMHHIASRWKSEGAALVKETIQTIHGTAEKIQAYDEFMVEADALSDKLERRLNVEELERLRKKYGLTERELEVADKTWAFMRKVISRVETIREGQLISARAEGTLGEVEFQREMKELRRDFGGMRNRNYLPHTRFGRYALHVTTNRANVKVDDYYTAKRIGATLLFEMFDNEKDLGRAVAEVKKRWGEHGKQVQINTSHLEDTDPTTSLLGFDARLVRTVIDGLGLEPEQRAQAEELLLKMSPTEGYRKRMIKRKNIPGYSDNTVRVVGDYAARFANFVSRLETVDSMRGAIDEMEEASRFLPPEDGVKRSRIINWTKEHLRYLQNPGNELAALRAVGFLHYLGLVPASAALNLSQVPMVGLPYLAANYGDLQATKELARAVKDVTAHLAKGKPYTQGEQAMLDAIGELIDESFASMLGALQEGSILQRMARGRAVSDPKTALRIQEAQEVASWMFSAAEQFNRRVMALATYRLAKAKGAGEYKAGTLARDAIEETQFEYARWNRPAMMRGKQSVFFLFQQFANSMMYFLAKPGTGRGRYLLIALLLAGVQGLPGAEDMMNLVDYLATKWKTALGYTNPKVEVRQDLRDFIKGLYDAAPWMPGDEDMWMKGIASEVGVPWWDNGPKFDVTGTLSMGRLVPGMEYLGREGVDPVTTLGRVAGALGGPLVALPIAALQAYGSNDPDLQKRWEKVMPRFMANLSKAERYAVNGMETDYQGDPLVKFDISNPAHLMEIAGQAAGFTPARLKKERETRWDVQEVKNYWSARAEVLREQAWRLYVDRDPAFNAKVREMVKGYNEVVPHPSFALNGKSLVDSIKSRATRVALKERGLGPEKKFADFYETEMENRGAPSTSPGQSGE